MSDGNSMNGLSSFHSYEDLAHYVSNTKPNMGRCNRGKIPLGERRYTSLFWCNIVRDFCGWCERGTAIEMFCESRGPVLRWYEDNSIEILSGNSHYDWRFAEFLSRTIHGVHFFTHHGKIYWREPKQHEIDPSHNAVVAMQVNHPEFADWCENELHLMGITHEQIYYWHKDSVNQVAETSNDKAVKQFGKYAEVHFNKSVHFPLYKGLADAALRCIPTPKLLKEMDMYSTITTEE